MSTTRWRLVVAALSAVGAVHVAPAAGAASGSPSPGTVEVGSVDRGERSRLQAAERQLEREARRILETIRPQLNGDGTVGNRSAGAANATAEFTTSLVPGRRTGQQSITTQQSFVCPGFLSAGFFSYFVLAEIIHYCPIPIDYYVSQFLWFDQFTGEILQVAGGTVPVGDFVANSLDVIFDGVGVRGNRSLIACGMPVIAGYVSTGGCGQLFYL